MCFTRRAKKGVRKGYTMKSIKVHPRKEPHKNDLTILQCISTQARPTPPPEFTMDETIQCHGCFQRFSLDQIKINCAGCDKFFHCKVAGTCYGDNCKEETRAGRLHRLSWCVDCVPKIPENKEKSDRTEPCICQKCHP